MKRRKINIKNVAKALNEVTPLIVKVSGGELYDIFKMGKVAYYNAIVPYLNKQGYTSIDDDGLYTWVKQEPVYYKEIEDVIVGARRKIKESRTKGKEILLDAIQSITPTSLTLTEENAIAFLKERGYKIMKPIVEYQEI